MTTIGFIGSGKIGGAVARRAIASGYDVVLSNRRGPDTLADLVAELGDHARAGSVEEAARAGDVVVLTIPLGAVRDVAPEPLRGKVVIDTCNYYPARDGHIAELDDESTTTSALVQAHLAGAKVVKGFNNIWFGHINELARPHGDPQRSSLTIAGDDTAAKATVSALLDDLGFDTYDAGSLAESWRFERDRPAYAQLYNADDPPVYPPQSSRQVGPDLIREKLAEATRTP